VNFSTVFLQRPWINTTAGMPPIDLFIQHKKKIHFTEAQLDCLNKEESVRTCVFLFVCLYIYSHPIHSVSGGFCNIMPVYLNPMVDLIVGCYCVGAL
jgi:hypothetical protein